MSNALGLEKSDGPIGGTNKSFGLMFAVIFLLAALYLVVKNSSTFAQIGALTASVTTFVIALIAPAILAKPNRYWMKFSLLLARFVSPIILGVLFYLLISPLAIVLRIFGRDELLLKRKKTSSYWKERGRRGYSIELFKNQY
jgi:flagellar biosynthesis protein FlhB